MREDLLLAQRLKTLEIGSLPQKLPVLVEAEQAPKNVKRLIEEATFNLQAKVVGLDSALRKLITWLFTNISLWQTSAQHPAVGHALLLHGPTGMGKTKLVQETLHVHLHIVFAILFTVLTSSQYFKQQHLVNHFTIQATEVRQSFAGQSETFLLETFAKAVQLSPCTYPVC